jgi:regulatory factor X
MHLRTFWSSLTGHHREIVHAPAIAGLMAKADAIVYDASLSSFLCSGKLMSLY